MFASISAAFEHLLHQGPECMCVCLQFVFVFATAAACVASQAMISAAFSIIKQSIALGCFPQLTILHVSDKVSTLKDISSPSCDKVNTSKNIRMVPEVNAGMCFCDCLSSFPCCSCSNCWKVTMKASLLVIDMQMQPFHTNVLRPAPNAFCAASVAIMHTKLRANRHHMTGMLVSVHLHRQH